VVRMQTLSELDIQIINQRLAETIAWCESRADITKTETCFRSKELEPSKNFDWYVNKSQRHSIINEVSNIRQTILHNEFPMWNAKTPDLALGRILAFEIDANLQDGAAFYASKGFFDWDNIPPWDTWFAYLPEYFLYERHSDILLSWIDQDFLPLVEEGIEVNPESCIFWFDDNAVQELFNQLEAEKTP
jgi:hypothetical protein